MTPCPTTEVQHNVDESACNHQYAYDKRDRSRGRCSRAGRGRNIEVGGFAALRGVVGCAHEGMDGCGSAGLDIMVVQIGIHIGEHLVLVAALGIDSEGFKHPLGLMEGATEHSAVVQALIDDLIERGLDPAVPRLFIIDGSKALAKAIRRSFGRHTPIQRCQIHKARNIMERLSPALHASVRRALRQAWELDDAAKAENLIRNLAQCLERDAPGVSKSILGDWMKSSRSAGSVFRRNCGARWPAPTSSKYDGDRASRHP